MRERSLEAQKYHELCVDLLPKMASLAWVAHFCDFPPINLHKRQMSMTLIIMSGETTSSKTQDHPKPLQSLLTLKNPLGLLTSRQELLVKNRF